MAMDAKGVDDPSSPRRSNSQLEENRKKRTKEDDSQLFCLRWNNYQSNLTNVFDQLLQNESFVDVTLASGDGQTVKAHKMVLSACSPYFQNLFFDNPCKHPIVILKDVKWAELKAVVEFMYKGEINVRQEQIGSLLKVAECLKIRGLADVNGDHDAFQDSRIHSPISVSSDIPPVARSPFRASPTHHGRKRRRTSADRGSANAEDYPNTNLNSPSRALEVVTSPSSSIEESANCVNPNYLTGTSAKSQSAAPSHSPTNVNSLPLPPAPPPPYLSSGVPAPSQSASNLIDDMEIKPAIAEMIREEERAKMLESSQAWLGASASGLTADSYQYQLQSMWQKCWNTNQNLVHNLRFRERGPLKSWRPETMAEAILSVLKEGLSLSQAARKYDIPYPTFVLYANRVHNMLGPSADGGSDLRPKGRGRPQRILLGFWPEDHIQNVIRAVVFRDQQHVKEEPLNLGYHRLACFQDPLSVYGNGNSSCMNSPERSSAASPNSNAVAAVAAMAQGLRQQMLAAAVVAHNSADPSNYGFLSQCTNGPPSNMLIPSPTENSPENSSLPSPSSNNNLEENLRAPNVTAIKQEDPENIFQEEDDEIEDLVVKTSERPSSVISSSSSSIDQRKGIPLVLDQGSE